MPYAAAALADVLRLRDVEQQMTESMDMTQLRVLANQRKLKCQKSKVTTRDSLVYARCRALIF